MGIRPMPNDMVDLEGEPDLSGLEPDPGSTEAVGDAITDLGAVAPPAGVAGPEGGI
jgi:hypothetical protein